MKKQTREESLAEWRGEVERLERKLKVIRKDGDLNPRLEMVILSSLRRAKIRVRILEDLESPGSPLKSF